MATKQIAPLRLERGRTVVRTWTTALVDIAERRAFSGDLSLLGELVDELLGDDRLATVLRTRAQGLFGLVPTFEAAGDGRRKGRAVRALEAQEDWWAMCPESESALVLMYGLLAGCCPVQLNWWEIVNGKPVARVRHGRNVPRIEAWSVSSLRFDFSAHAWQVDVGATAQDFVPFLPGNGQDALFAPFSERRPWMHGLWRGLAPWWLLKQYARSDFGRAGETAASTSIEADPAIENSEDLRKQLAESVAQLTRDGVIALPPGYSIKLIEASATTHEIYNRQIALANEAFAIAGLGHNLTTQVESGSLAAASVGQDVKLELRCFDAEAWSTFAHDQVNTPWAKCNFGNGELAPWPLYPVQPPKDRTARAQQLSTLADALAKLPPDADKRALLEEFEVPMLSEEEVQKQREQAPTPPTPGAPPSSGDEPDAGEPAQPQAEERAAAPDPLLAWLTADNLAAEASLLRASEWTKRLSDAAGDIAPGAMRSSLDAALAAVEQATTPAQLQAALAELADDAPNPEMERVLERLMILASSAGVDSLLRVPDGSP